MSDDEASFKTSVHELHESVMQVSRLLPWIRWLIFGAFALGGWVAVLQFQLSDSVKSIREINTRMAELQEWRASARANEFTARDFVAARTTIDERASSLDRRITVLETKMDQIAQAANAAATTSANNTALLKEILTKLPPQK